MTCLLRIIIVSSSATLSQHTHTLQIIHIKKLDIPQTCMCKLFPLIRMVFFPLSAWKISADPSRCSSNATGLGESYSTFLSTPSFLLSQNQSFFFFVHMTLTYVITLIKQQPQAPQLNASFIRDLTCARHCGSIFDVFLSLQQHLKVGVILSMNNLRPREVEDCVRSHRTVDRTPLIPKSVLFM